MSDIMRLLDRMVRPFGYRVRKQVPFNLLPPTGLVDRLAVDDLAELSRRSDRLSSSIAPSNLRSLTVCVRTCLRSNRHGHVKPRVTGVSAEETVLRCLLSLVRSCNYAVSSGQLNQLDLLLFDDHSDPSALRQVEQILSLASFPFEIRTTRETGQGASLHQQFEFAANQDRLFYFCEDDYLHVNTAVSEYVDFYQLLYAHTGLHIALHPQESVRHIDHIYPAYIIKTAHRHWRTTCHMTHTLFTHGAVVGSLWPLFDGTKYVGDPKHRHLGAESKTTNRIFNTITGFCPIQAVAGHLQTEYLLPRFFDWRTLWEANDPGIYQLSTKDKFINSLILQQSERTPLPEMVD